MSFSSAAETFLTGDRGNATQLTPRRAVEDWQERLRRRQMRRIRH